MKTFMKYAFIVLLLFGGCKTDFHTKKWANSNLKGKPPVTVVKGFIDLGFAENRGMVFGILNDGNANTFKKILMGIRIAVLAVVSVLIVIGRKRKMAFLMPFLLLWIGGAGNIIDPFVYGYVVDFIHIRAGTVLDWPFFFNLADAYLCIGMALLVFNGSIFEKKTWARPVS